MKYFGLVFMLAVALCAVLVQSRNIEDQVSNPTHHHHHDHHGHHGHHEAVDFGAHTGDSGAYGWHADFPVHEH